ncbi:dTDP-glucose 4,6-dehydratase [Nitrospira tepida]|uniref:dTDP-glucose 4,6-dehydratase n=1 Tax=Nitrospira tepida TaxID=2973512 RepID=A0AA86N0T5_9BACT|nr:NAD-dependent epimerase/dehydratase family protein [Nitrospira tepida]CAI4032579.1 dTDP-glucose 4,6-dehydratase [Nitrospira tepida]
MKTKRRFKWHLSSNNLSELSAQARVWLADDWMRVEQALGDQARQLQGKRILLTGAAGFLGFNFLHFFSYLNGLERSGERGRSKAIRVVAADNFLRGYPRWLAELAMADANIEIRRRDIVKPWLKQDSRFDYIIHGASVASPTFYRQYPLETLDANVTGLRNMLELALRAHVDSMLFFSSSEIYGDPPPDEIPTKESYRGNVACTGPRACYDESKRLGETLCYIYAEKYHVPVKIVRPFNNYGPGLRINDRRVLPDFCSDVLAGRNIAIYSDGSPTRTFCYSSDALTGYLLTLLSVCSGEAFNIGTDGPEISMRDLGRLVAKLAGEDRGVECRTSTDAAYLKDNPQRRCPDLSKARQLLGYQPQVYLEDGLDRLLQWYRRFLPLEESIQ